jgi:YbbR domain-containing protein
MTRSRITRDLGLRAVAILSALLLWFHLATERDGFERVMAVPLSLSGVPADQVVVDPVPAQVQVRFRGNGKQLLLLTWRHKAVVVDVSGVRTRRTLTLDLSQVRYPEGRELAAVEIVAPLEITVELDRASTVVRPVGPVLELGTAAGYTRVGPIAALPGSVAVSGPRSRIERLTIIWTDTLRLDRVRTPVEQEVPLQLPGIHNVTLEPRSVRIVQDIQPIVEQSFAEIPVRLLGTGGRNRYLAQPRTARVTVSGGSHLIEALTGDQVRLFIDVRSEAADGLTPLVPRVELPTGITLLKVEPSTFRVTEY